LPPALPSPGLFPVEFVIASTGTHEELVRAADQLVVAAMESNQFAFPPVMDVRIDQTKAEIVFDREKVASMGLSMQQVGADLATMLGGNYVNRFNMEGRSYKVIAQVERSGRLTPDDLGRIHVTGPGGALIPLSSIATFRTVVEPRTLNRFQQLNAVKISVIGPYAPPRPGPETPLLVRNRKPASETSHSSLAWDESTATAAPCRRDRNERFPSVASSTAVEIWTDTVSTSPPASAFEPGAPGATRSSPHAPVSPRLTSRKENNRHFSP
jgi:hypothetical protein